MVAWGIICICFWTIPLLCFLFGLTYFLVNYIKFKLDVIRLKHKENKELTDVSSNAVSYLMYNKKFKRKNIVLLLIALIKDEKLNIVFNDKQDDFRIMINQEKNDITESEQALIDNLFYFCDEYNNVSKKTFVTKDDLINNFYDDNISDFECDLIYTKISREIKNQQFFSNEVNGKVKKITNLLKTISLSTLIVTAVIMLGGLSAVGLLMEYIPGFEILLDIIKEALFMIAVFRNNPKMLMWLYENLIWVPIIVTGVSGLIYWLIVYFSNIINSYSGLTEKGKEYYGKCKGLKKYLKNFDVDTEKEIVVKDWVEYYALSVVFELNEKFYLKLKKDSTILDSKDSCMLKTFETIVVNLKKQIPKTIDV